MEDEIDLRKEKAVLLKHWKLIVIIILLAGAVALAVSLLAPPVYEARSRVSILIGDAAQLLTLASSNSIADEVGKEAINYFKSGDLTAGKILAAVKAKQQGNMIEFTAQYNDPAKAAFIANGWAQQYTAYVDNFFSMTGRTLQEARSYAGSVKKIYEEKQKALLDFEATNHIEKLTRDINDLKLLMDLLSFRDSIKSMSVEGRQDKAVKMLYCNYKIRAITGQAGSAVTDVDKMPEVTVSDIDNLVSLLELRADVKQGITAEEIRSRISGLKYQLDAETVNSTEELTGQRDAALKAYQAALARVSDAEIAQITSVGYVRVADKAVAPDAPLPDNRRWTNVAIGLVVGFIIGVIGAFAVEYFNKTARKPENKTTDAR